MAFFSSRAIETYWVIAFLIWFENWMNRVFVKSIAGYPFPDLFERPLDFESLLPLPYFSLSLEWTVFENPETDFGVGTPSFLSSLMYETSFFKGDASLPNATLGLKLFILDMRLLFG
jgi:hypothetical protein